MDPAQIERTVAIALRALFGAIQARRAERFHEARGAFQTAIELGLPPDLRRRAEAEIAHLLYYDGRFADGVASARRVLEEGPRDFARALALLALSVNQLANNEAPAALRSANEALLEMRVLGSPSYHVVNVKLQLVHVSAQMGHAAESVRIAREAHAEAEQVANEHQRARAEYGLGYALWAAGDLATIDRFVRAAELARAGPASLYAWIVDDIGRAGTSNWGFFEPVATLECLTFVDRHGIRRDAARRLIAAVTERTEGRADEDAALAPRSAESAVAHGARRAAQ